MAVSRPECAANNVLSIDSIVKPYSLNWPSAMMLKLSLSNGTGR
jgi:hypothetical protein